VSEYDETEKDAYEALELPEGASQAEIKERYRKLARQLHSDVNATGDESKLKKINWAYETLTNPAQIEARDRARRSAVAAQAKADAARRAAEAKAKAARDRRKRSASDAQVFDARIQGQSGAGTRPSTPKAPSSTPPSSSSSLGQKLVPTSASLLWRVAFLAAPIGIMFFVVPAMNAHPNIILDLISIGCFFWLLAGIAGLFIEW
jgi:curved DNA-binding protein CbpA